MFCIFFIILNVSFIYINSNQLIISPSMLKSIGQSLRFHYILALFYPQISIHQKFCQENREAPHAMKQGFAL